MVGGASRAAAKGPEAFRTISEASSELGVPQHVLRFWETKFSFIRPMKRAGGRRFYRRQDIAMLNGVRVLLHQEGYSIKGVQRLHKEMGVRRLIGAGEGEAPPPAAAMQAPRESATDTEAELFEIAPESVDAQPPPSDTAILKPAARARLQGVLKDLETVKADIDGLLALRHD